MSARSLLRLGLLALLWGSNFLLIAFALESFAPEQVLVGRLVLGMLTVVGILLASGQRLPTGIGVWKHLAVAAVVGNVVPYYLFAWAEQTVASSLAGVLNATTPLFTLAIGVAARQERHVSADRALGLVVGFAGVLAILAPWTAADLGGLAGQAGVLLASALYGVVYVYQRRYLTGRGVPPLALAAGQLVAASAALLPVIPVVLTAPVSWDVLPVASVIALGALGTGVAYAINFRLIQDEGATNASTVTYLLPVIAVVLGALFLAEAVSLNVVLGTLTVFVGIALTQQRLRPLAWWSARFSATAPAAAVEQPAPDTAEPHSAAARR